MSKIDCDYTREVVCPHCGHEQSDSWEINFGIGLEGDAEIQCGECGEDFIASRQAEITYSSKKLPEATLAAKQKEGVTK